MITDSHNHTCHFSSDAEMSISELIDSCVSRNIKRAVITEHYDYDYPHPEIPPQVFDLAQYYDAVKLWKKLSNDVEINMGIELGYQPHVADKIEEISKMFPFDSIILSVHVLEGKDVYYYPECYKKYTKEELNRKYIEVLVEMADRINGYDIIGHYDYINRYSKKRNAKMLYSDCPKEFDNLFEILITKEKSLEINTKSIYRSRQKKHTDIMPDKEILLRYKDMGGTMITLGSDAHKKGSVGILFEETGEYLRSLGFKTNTYFIGRKPFEETL